MSKRFKRVIGIVFVVGFIFLSGCGEKEAKKGHVRIVGTTNQSFSIQQSQ